MQINLFPSRLAKLRKAAGLSQSKLGQKAETDGMYISRLERGVFLPSLDAAIRIALALNCTLDDLVNARSKNPDKS